MDKNNAYFVDSSIKEGYGYIPLLELMDRWHDFEEKNGSIERFIQAGIVISGKKALKSFPAPITRIE